MPGVIAAAETRDRRSARHREVRLSPLDTKFDRDVQTRFDGLVIVPSPS